MSTRIRLETRKNLVRYRSYYSFCNQYHKDINRKLKLKKGDDVSGAGQISLGGMVQRDEYDGTPGKGCEKNPGKLLEGFDGDDSKRWDSNHQHPQKEYGY